MIQLKWDKSAEGAIGQLRDKQYIDALKDYMAICFWQELIMIKRQNCIAVLLRNGICNIIYITLYVKHKE